MARGFHSPIGYRRRPIRLLVQSLFLILCAHFDAAAEAPNVSPGMINWWNGDNSTQDIVGGKHGILRNAATYGPGLVGGAFQLAGYPSNDYIEVPDSDLWAFGSGDFTIELWAKFDSSLAGRDSVFIGHDEGGGNRNKWFFGKYIGKLLFHINGPGIGPQFFPQVDFNPSAGQWYHLAVTRRGDTYTIYVNGTPEGTAINAEVLPNPNASLTIGHAEGIGYVHGSLDEISIYHRALSSEEIRSIHLAGPNGKHLRLFVTSVTPHVRGKAVSGTLTLKGVRFADDATVSLISGIGVYPASGVQVISPNELTASFDFPSIPTGEYLVRVSADGETSEIPFTLVEGGEGLLTTRLILPAALGYHVSDTIFVEVANSIDTPISAPVLVVRATQNGREGAYLTTDSSKVIADFWTLGLGWHHSPPEGSAHSVQLIASGSTPGQIQPGEIVRVPIYYIGWAQPWDYSYSPIEFSVGMLGSLVSTPVDWASRKTEMRPDSIPSDAWDAIWANFLQEAGTTWADYEDMLSENAQYLGTLGLSVSDIGQLLNFEFAQANGLNIVRQLSASTDARVRAPGIAITFERVFGQSITDRYRMGPLGRGWSHNWDFSLLAADGRVTITGPGGSGRVYQPDSRNPSVFFSPTGDYSSLTPLGGGTYRLQEPGGMKRVFRADGNLDYVEDTNGNRITLGYTDSRLTTLTHSGGQSVTITYNAASLIESITDHLGRSTTLSYDPANQHLASATYFDGSTVSYAYSTGNGIQREHALTEITYPGGIKRHYTYDAKGRLASTSATAGAETVSFSYDSSGRVNVTDALTHTTAFFFDHRGLIAKVTDPLGEDVTMKYDAHNNLLQLTDPASKSYAYSYDSRGNLLKITDPLNAQTRFQYNGPFNRLTKLTDANGNPTTYAYDAQGNLRTITYADASVESWTYGAEGLPETWTNRRGHDIGYNFNADGEIDDKTIPGKPLTDYEYDSRGNLIAATNEVGTIAITYYPPGHPHVDKVKRITYPGGQWLEYTYHTCGQRASMLDQLGHRLDYHYDAAGRLERLTDELEADIVTYSYDAAGRMERKTLANGIYTTYTYDGAGHLLDLHNKAADDSTLSRFQYTYDARGRRDTMTTIYAPSDPRTAAGLSGKWTYTYDDLGQLTGWTSPDGTTVSYSYDAMGNRLSETHNGTNTAYAVTSMNRYSNVGEATWTYDLDGNVNSVTGSVTATYAFDSENRLVGINTVASSASFLYDALGSRSSIAADGNETQIIVDPFGLGNLVGTYSTATGQLDARFEHGVGLIACSGDTGPRHVFTFDAIGSTSEILSPASSVVQYQYEPFGASRMFNTETVPAFLEGNQMQFCSEYGVKSFSHSESMLQMGARNYNFSIGRFLSVDPVNILGGDVSAYRYAQNSPVAMLDPSGTSGDYDNVVRNWLTIGFRKYGADYQSQYDWLTSMRDRHPHDTTIRDAHHWLEQRLNFGNPGSDVAAGAKTWLWSGAGIAWPAVKNVLAGIDSLPVIQLKPNNLPFFDEPEQRNEWLIGDWNEIRWNVSGIWDSMFDYVAESVGPNDPNEKTGPTGVGDLRFTANGERLPYKIEFENMESAAVPAQAVTISDPLSANFDWTSFELTEVAFGDHVITAPPGSQPFTWTEPVTINGVSFEVQISAGINPSTGEVYANFYSVDPATGLPPPINVGFLPPNARDAEGNPIDGRGQGHVSFTIKAKDNLPSGTQIRNIAYITFDGAQTIPTNIKDPSDPSQGTDPDKEAHFTVDSASPTSSVAPLPAEVSALHIPVRWGGDDGSGSGISHYDVYLSEDGGPFEPLLLGTTETNTIVLGRNYHTYYFFSVATDNTGQREEAPSYPDSVTSVRLSAPELTAKITTPIREIELSLSGLYPGALYSIEWSTTLRADDWFKLNTFEAVQTNETWLGSLAPDWAKAFWRVRVE